MVDAMVEVDAFREDAAAWLAANMAPVSSSRSKPRGADHRTAEQMAVERALQAKVFEGGYAGITWPVEYGGRGLTEEHEAAFLEAAAKYRMPDLGLVGATTFGVVAKVLMHHGHPSFLRERLPRILSGDELWCELFSEPGAGSDLAGVTTRATRDGDRWILNGSKIWTSGAAHSAYGLCIARTNWDVPKHRGLTWFCVPLDAPGLEVQPIREINGDFEFCQEFLDDVEVAPEAVVGDVDDGWTVSQTMLMYERGGGSPVHSLEAMGEQGFAPEFVRLARRVGRENDPLARQLIARAHAYTTVQNHLGRRIAQHFVHDPERATTIASYAKLTLGTFDPIRGRIAMAIGGRAAVAWDPANVKDEWPVLDYLNSRVNAIAGGTNEMMRNIVGERLLGLPREPSFDTKKPFNEVQRMAAEWK